MVGEPCIQRSSDGLKNMSQIQTRPCWTSGSSVAFSGQYEVKPSHQRRNRSCQQHIVYTMLLKKANPHQLCSGKPEDESCLTILNSFASGVRLNRSISNNLNPHDSFYQKKNARKCWWRRKLSWRNRFKSMYIEVDWGNRQLAKMPFNHVVLEEIFVVCLYWTSEFHC